MRGAEAPGAHLPRDREGGRKEGRGALPSPPTHRTNIPPAQREGGGPAPLRLPLPLPLWGIKSGRESRSAPMGRWASTTPEVQVSQSQA